MFPYDVSLQRKLKVALACIPFGVTRPLLDDSRVPHPLETPPRGYHATLKKETDMKRLLIMTVIMTSMVLASCNVMRTITTQSQYFQHGDTTCTIVTKTIEQYDASKKL